jgi:hypothetical protein
MPLGAYIGIKAEDFIPLGTKEGANARSRERA